MQGDNALIFHNQYAWRRHARPPLHSDWKSKRKQRWIGSSDGNDAIQLIREHSNQLQTERILRPGVEIFRQADTIVGYRQQGLMAQLPGQRDADFAAVVGSKRVLEDRKSTRLNSSHLGI